MSFNSLSKPLVAGFSILVCLSVIAPVPAIDLPPLPLVTPRLDGFTASIQIDGGAPIDGDLSLRFDEKGKIICHADCFIDGAAVAAKGTVKNRKGVLSYTLSLKGIAEKVRLKVRRVSR